MHRVAVVALLLSLRASAAMAQQRPLLTEDPEPVGAGRVLLEAGLDLAHKQTYPVSGLEGNLLRVPLVGISVGISSIAEMQIDGGFFNRLSITDRKAAPLSHLLNFSGDHTHDVEDFVIGTKIRLISEATRRPAVAIRFATKLPNASNESGLGLDTTDFHAALLIAKGIQSMRVVGNLGLGILGDPISGNRQNDVLDYGVSIAKALTERWEVVAELNGRMSLRSSGAAPGTESRGRLEFGSRFTLGAVRMDGGMLVGLTSDEPAVGVTVGVTYVFDAFKLP